MEEGREGGREGCENQWVFPNSFINWIACRPKC